MKNQITAPRPAASGATLRDVETTRPLVFGVGVAALVYFVLAFVYFLPAFLPGQHIYGTDYFAGGYFFYQFVSERLAAGALPKWVPYIFGGLPLFANPGSAYHPVHLLASLVLPTDRVLPTVFVFQFAMAGLGMYLLAAELGCRRWVAFLAGLAFQFTGITNSWVYAGHDGRIIVVTLAPLFLFFLHRGIRTARLPAFAGAAATLAFALLSFQIQNAYYLLLAGAAWAVFSIVHLGRAKEPAVLARVVALGLGAVGLGFVLASVNFLPFLGYVPEATRGVEGGRGYEYSVSYSMPAQDLVGVAVPEQVGVSVGNPVTGQALFPAYTGPNGFKLHTEYVGATVLLLFALGFLYARRNRYWQFFAGLGVFAITMALGGNTPLYRLYYAVLPGLNKFRAPDLAYYLIALSLVAMAAITLEQVARLRAEAEARRTPDEALEGRLKKAWVPVGVVVALAVLGAVMAGGEAERAAGWMRFTLFAVLSGGAIAMWSARKIGTVAAAAALMLITVSDLWVIDRKFFHTVPPPAQTFAADDVVAFLLQQPQPNRVWVLPMGPAYHGAGDYLMQFGISQAGGEHPNILASYNEYVGEGPGALPDWHNLAEYPALMDAANVRYLISTVPIESPALREVHRGSALVYENANALPRAYLVPEVVSAPDGSALQQMEAPGFDPRRTAVVEGAAAPALPSTPLAGSAEVTEYAPDEVVVRTRADRAAFLVLADNFYPGWRVSVDGQPAEVLRTNHTFRGVEVGAGEHEVRFTFHPARFYQGLWIYSIGFGVLALYGVFLLARTIRRRATSATAA